MLRDQPQQHLRVLTICATMVPRSGWGRYADAIVRGVRNEGLHCDVIAMDLAGDMEGSRLVPDDAPFSMIRNIIRVRRIARNADVVHSFDVWRLGVYGYFAVLGTGKKLFITGVGTYSIAPRRFALMRPKESLKRLLMMLAINRSRMIFCISSYTKKRMFERIHSSNLATVYWGTSPIRALPPSRVAEFRKEYAVPENAEPILLTVGQVKHRKGQRQVAEAVRALKKKYPNIFYAIVGSDTDTLYCGNLRAFIAEHGLTDNVRLYPNVSTDEGLAFFYGCTDIFIMTSNNQGDEPFEGFGLVFLEAEQFGKPVIGSRDCGIEDALQDGYNGYLVEQGDVEDIEQKIMRVLEGDRELLGKRSKDFASRFTWEKTVRRCIEYYRA